MMSLQIILAKEIYVVLSCLCGLYDLNETLFKSQFEPKLPSDSTVPQILEDPKMAEPQKVESIMKEGETAVMESTKMISKEMTISKSCDICLNFLGFIF